MAMLDSTPHVTSDEDMGMECDDTGMECDYDTPTEALDHAYSVLRSYFPEDAYMSIQEIHAMTGWGPNLVQKALLSRTSPNAVVAEGFTHILKPQVAYRWTEAPAGAHPRFCLERVSGEALRSTTVHDVMACILQAQRKAEQNAPHAIPGHVESVVVRAGGGKADPRSNIFATGASDGIPTISSPEHLAFYGFALIDAKDLTTFTINSPTGSAPIIPVYVGSNSNNRGGLYFEKHDPVHLWAPLSPGSGGFVTVAKAVAPSSRQFPTRWHSTTTNRCADPGCSEPHTAFQICSDPGCSETHTSQINPHGCADPACDEPSCPHPCADPGCSEPHNYFRIPNSTSGLAQPGSTTPPKGSDLAQLFSGTPRRAPARSASSAFQRKRQRGSMISDLASMVTAIPQMAFGLAKTVAAARTSSQLLTAEPTYQRGSFRRLPQISEPSLVPEKGQKAVSGGEELKLFRFAKVEIPFGKLLVCVPQAWHYDGTLSGGVFLTSLGFAHGPEGTS